MFCSYFEAEDTEEEDGSDCDGAVNVADDVDEGEDADGGGDCCGSTAVAAWLLNCV